MHAVMCQDRKENGLALSDSITASTHLLTLCPSAPEMNALEGPSLAQWGAHEPVLCAVGGESLEGAKMGVRPRRPGLA